MSDTLSSSPLLELEASLALQAPHDPEAFAKLYEIYLPKIFGYVSRRISDRAEAEDLVANIFLRVVENLHRFQPHKSSFKTWIYTVATRMMIDHFRTQSKKRHEDLELAESVPDPTAAPAEQAKNEENRQLVFSIIQRLSPRHQHVLFLRFFSDFSISELAEALAISENNASVMLHRALQQFEVTYQLGNL